MPDVRQKEPSSIPIAGREPMAILEHRRHLLSPAGNEAG